MPVKITYFVHGTIRDNKQQIWSGWRNIDLSSLGVKQSKELALQINKSFDIIFCSDLIRAIHSANLIFGSK